MIAIEGSIGVGKTTLQNQLSNIHDFSKLSQEFESNCCLKDYYEYPQEYALQKNMIFLFSDYHLLKKSEKTNKMVISDYCFEKSDIFAKFSLNKDEYEKVFKPCYDYLYQQLNPIDTLIFLYGSSHLILRNIKYRGRGYEQQIDSDFIGQIQKEYFKYLPKINCKKIIEINIDTTNIMNNDFLTELLNSII